MDPLASGRRRLLVRSFVFLAAAILSAETAHAAITGTVRDRQTNGSLGAMVAAAYSPDGFLQASSTTGSNGKYTLNVAPGSYRVLAFDPQGVFATSYGNDADSFENSPVVSSETVADFALTRAGFATGQVFGGSTPLPNATVEAYNLSGTRRGFANADGGGNYRLVLPPGEYKLVSYLGTSWGPKFFDDRRSFGDADLVTILAGQTFVAGFSLSVPGRFSGRVTDAAAMPLASKIVYAYTPAGSFVATTTTNSEGLFSIALAPGGYRFVAADPNLEFANDFVGDAQSFDRSPVVTLMPGQERQEQFILERGGRILGRAVDSSSGQPIIGVTVAAYNLDGTIRTALLTDASGMYTLTLPAGSYKIGAFDARLIYATTFYDNSRDFTRATPVSVTAGTGAFLNDFVLRRGTPVGGTVTDQTSGAPVGRVTVGAYDLDGNLISSAMTNSQGIYTLVLLPGTYKFLVFDTETRYAIGYADGAATFESTQPRQISAGTFEQLNFSIRPGVPVAGSVRDVSGAPLSDIEVIALDMAGNRVASTRSLDGAFRIALAEGSYKFVAVDPVGRYQPLFYRGLDFSSAEVVTVVNGSGTTISFTLIKFQRRRSARH
jgi:hypothetical protein